MFSSMAWHLFSVQHSHLASLHLLVTLNSTLPLPTVLSLVTPPILPTQLLANPHFIIPIPIQVAKLNSV